MIRRGRLGPGIVEQWIGYTREEVGRIHAPRVAWITDRFPWVEKGWYRFNVIQFLREFARGSLFLTVTWRWVGVP